MRRHARFGSLLGAAALAGAVVLLWPNAPTASAASGTFTYTDAAGVSKTSANPPDDYCIVLPGAGEAANDTDSPVGFYKTADCKQKVASVGQGDSGSVPTFGSVKFSRDDAPKKPDTHRAPERRPEPKHESSKSGSLPLGILGS
jgi:hypothetical protein